LADEEPENDKTDAGRVQTQMYAMQISAAFTCICEPFLPLHQLNYQEY
jgi:hypothetical protein